MIDNSLPKYITHGTVHGEEVIGIVKIKSKQYITLYDFSKIIDTEDKKELIKLAKDWWTQSNHSIPISIFIKSGRMQYFEKFTVRYNTDDFVLLNGPLTSISDLPRKRIKRRNIALKPRDPRQK